MAIITISRGSLSGGARLAEIVAKKLGYDCVSREFLVEAAEHYGMKKEDLVFALEKPPSFWERITHGRRVYLSIIRAALLERASSGNLVYHGHAGHFLLKQVGCVLKVRLLASMEMRIKAAMEQKGLDRESAIQYIQTVDDARTRWTRYLYGVEWNDPSNFDIVLNLGTMTIETAANLILQAIEAPEFRVCEACMKELQNLTLAAKVEAALAVDRRTKTVELDIRAEDGAVLLGGRIEAETMRPTIVEIVKSVPGVKSVRDEMVVKSLSPIPT